MPHVQVDVIRCVEVFHPNTNAALPNDFAAQPPASKVDLMHATIDHRPAFQHSANAQGTGDHLTLVIPPPFAVQVPQIHQSQRTHFADRSFANKAMSLNGRRTEPIRKPGEQHSIGLFHRDLHGQDVLCICRQRFFAQHMLAVLGSLQDVFFM